MKFRIQNKSLKYKYLVIFSPKIIYFTYFFELNIYFTYKIYYNTIYV